MLFISALLGAAFVACADLGGLTGAGSDSPDAVNGGEDTLGTDAGGVDGTTGNDGSGSTDAETDTNNNPFFTDAACPIHFDAGLDAAANVKVLAVGETSPVRIATNYASVFWINQNGANTAIRACAATGCNGVPSTVTTFNRAYGFLTVDGVNAYYTDGYTPGTVWKCASTGCADGSVITNNLYAPNGITTDGLDVYWAITGSGIIGACKAPDCSTPKELVTNESNPRRIAVDATDVFWMTGSLVRACKRSGCNNTPRSLAGGQTAPGEGALTLSSTTIFWANGTSNAATINACDKNGCNLQPTVVVPNLTSAPRDIVVDGANLYWIDSSSLKTCPINNCVMPQTLLSLTNPQALVLDARKGCASALYWVLAGGSVMKLVL